MITTFLRSHLVRLKSKKISYSNYKRFDNLIFLEDVKNVNFVFDTEDIELNYENQINAFCSVIDKHAPLKQNNLTWKSNFRSRLKNICNKNPPETKK